MTSYGVIFPKFSLFPSSNEDTGNLWTLVTLLCIVEALCKLICDNDICTSEWRGWILVYLMKYYFNLCGR